MSDAGPEYIGLDCDVCGEPLRELHHMVNKVSWAAPDGTMTYKHLCEICFPKRHDNRKSQNARPDAANG